MAALSPAERETLWAEAMRAGRRGNQAAYARVLAELAGALRAMLRRKMSGLPAADIEDVVQDVLLAIHTKQGSWDETRPLMPWVRAIAEHKMIDHARRRRRAGKVFSDTLSADDLAEIAPQSEPEFDQTGLNVERFLAKLTDKQRAIVRALTLEEASIAKVAADMKMTEGAVRVALHRGLQALARIARGSETAR